MKLQKYLSLHSSGVLKPSWDRTIELLTELHEGQETALFFPLTALTFSGSFPELSTQVMRCAVPFSVVAIVLWLSVLGANYLNLQKQSFRQGRPCSMQNIRKGSLSAFAESDSCFRLQRKPIEIHSKYFFGPSFHLFSISFPLVFDERSDRYLTSREMLGGRWQASKLQ